jgi:hypothetical protein
MAFSKMDFTVQSIRFFGVPVIFEDSVEETLCIHLKIDAPPLTKQISFHTF